MLFQYFLSFIVLQLDLLVDKIIYTHPLEFFQIYLIIILYTVYFCIFPYLLWQILDFCSSSVYINELQALKLYLNVYIFLYFLLNIFNLYFFLPKLWEFIHEFTLTTIEVSFELKIIDYFYFLIEILYFFNLILILFFFFYFFIFITGITYLLSIKKLCFVLNIMFATLLSPPDIFSQLIFVICLTCVLESLLFVMLVFFKLTKLKTELR